MVTELPDTIEIRHTITRSFVRYTFVTCLLTYFNMYDHLDYTKTTVFLMYRPIAYKFSLSHF